MSAPADVRSIQASGAINIETGCSMSVKQQHESLARHLALSDDPDSRAVEELSTAIGSFLGICEQLLEGCSSVDEATGHLNDLICESIVVKHSVDKVSGILAARADKEVSLLTCTEVQQRELAGRLRLLLGTM